MPLLGNYKPAIPALLLLCPLAGCASFPLENAINRNDAARAVDLINQNQGLGEVDGFGRTPLHDAARMENPDVARLLLAKGATVDARDNWGDTPLLIAADYHRLATCRALLDAGADVNAADQWGNTPLMNACDSKNPRTFARQIPTVQLLLLHDANVKAANHYGWTALHFAARACDPAVLSMLLARGADPHQANQFGYQPLHVAVQSNRPANAFFLLDHGALPTALPNDPRTGGRTYQLAAKYMEGRHQISLAAEYYRAAAGEFMNVVARCRDFAQQAQNRADNFTWLDQLIAHLGDGADTRQQEYAQRDAERREADQYMQLADQCAARANTLQTSRPAARPGL